MAFSKLTVLTLLALSVLPTLAKKKPATVFAEPVIYNGYLHKLQFVIQNRGEYISNFTAITGYLITLPEVRPRVSRALRTNYFDYTLYPTKKIGANYTTMIDPWDSVISIPGELSLHLHATFSNRWGSWTVPLYHGPIRIEEAPTSWIEQASTSGESPIRIVDLRPILDRRRSISDSNLRINKTSDISEDEVTVLTA